MDYNITRNFKNYITVEHTAVTTTEVHYSTFTLSLLQCSNFSIKLWGELRKKSDQNSSSLVPHHNLKKMKFLFAVLCTLALAFGVQSSVLPWGYPQVVVGDGHTSYTAVSSPYVAGAWGPWGGAWGGAWSGAWGPWAHGAAVDVAPFAGVQGTYVAKTRGAVHTAPLDGHVKSVANVNVAPAPGTL
ncbi:adult cuticle protein 1-like [Haematobia irritans]|uniref:adult cuticle protein 1-like n=1 Tax=Haematobia irritans TaxID=7368 RepID=UPI003F4F823E